MSRRRFYLIFSLAITLLLLTGCSNKRLKLIGTYTANEHGDLVGDNFKVEYNDKNDIVAIESGELKETFDYIYNDDGSVQYIGIQSSNSSLLPNTKVNVTYYENGKIFLMSLSNSDGYNTEQYYLYNSDDELKYIIQRILQSDGTVLSEYLTNFKYFTENGVEYILETTYAVKDGSFVSGRTYTKQSTTEYTNNLEKLGITTMLMHEKGYNKLKYQSQTANLMSMPMRTLFYSSKVLSWVNNNVLMIAIYDPNGNYIYTRNSSMTQTLYKKSDAYYREIISGSNYESYLHRTYKYIVDDDIVSKLEVYEETITESEYNKLKDEYEENNKNIDYVDVSNVFANYINSTATNIGGIYEKCMSTIRSNWNNYEKYKNSDVSSSSNSITNNKNESDSFNGITNGNFNYNNSSNNSNNGSNSGSNSSSESGSNNNTNSNVKEEIPSLNVSVVKWGFSRVHVNISTDTSGCKANIYLNGKMVITNVSISSISSTQELLDNLAVGTNTIKVELLKDNKVVNSKEATYNFDYETIPTPKLSINRTNNTYNSKYSFTIFTDKNGCETDDRCRLELYVNGEKQRNTYDAEVPLNMGDNSFKFELKNLFGKTSCKMVVVKRFEYDPNVLSVQLGTIQVNDC